MKFYKVVLTGIIMTQDEDPHPNDWDWSADKIYYRYQDMGGDGADVKITLLQDTLDTSEPGEGIIPDGIRCTHDLPCPDGLTEIDYIVLE